MYCDFFGLRLLPFEDQADTQFFYPTGECEEALAALDYEIHHGTGLGLLIGETGTGKTLLLRTLLLRLQKSDQAVVVTWPASGTMDLVRQCCKGFGVTLPSSQSQSRCLNRLRRHLGRYAATGNRSILIVDQAENLSPDNIAQLATLAELCVDRGGLLTIILAAQPLVRALLDRPEFARIRQQLFGERTLSPLTPKETSEYIRHRLQIAGAGDTRLFDDRAISLIHEISEGIPRLINRISNATMLVAYSAQTPCISRTTVEEATARTTVCERTVAARDLGLATIGEGVAPWLSILVPPDQVASSVEAPTPQDPIEPSVASANIPGQEDFDDPWSDANAVIGASIADGECAAFSGESLSVSPNKGTFLLARLERATARAERVTTSNEASLARLAAVEKNVASFIGRGERLNSSLAPALQQKIEAFDGMERRILDLAAQAERHTSDVESRLVRVSEIAAQSEDSARRVERACTLGGDVEARLTAFAERLADKADEVQHRVTTLMSSIQATEATQTRLAALVEQAASVSRSSEESVAAIRSQIRTTVEEGERELQRRSNTEIERCERQIHERAMVCERVGQVTAEKARVKLESLLQHTCADAESTIERQRTAAHETTVAIQAKVDLLLQRVSTTTIEADDKLNALAIALERTIAEGQQAQQRLAADSLERHRVALGDQFQAVRNNAQEVVDALQGRLDANMLHLTSATAEAERSLECITAPLKAAMAEGERLEKQLTESLPRRCRGDFDSLLEQFRTTLSGELASMQQAAAEAVDSAKSRLDGVLGHVSSATTDAERVANDLTAKLKTTVDEPARHGAQLIQEIRTTGERIAAIQQQVASSLIEIGIGCERVTAARAQAGECEQIAAASEGCRAAARQIQAVVSSASQVHDALQGLVAHADEKVGRLSSHHAAASLILDRLSSANLAGHQSVERQQALCNDASAASERLAAKIASSACVLETERAQLRDLAASADSLGERIGALYGNTSEIETRIADCMLGPSTITERAQAQAAQLEQVCLAVRKVFANLAEETLKAQHQTEAMRSTSEDANERLAELVAETDRATRTLHEWVEEALRTQSRLEQTLGECPSIRQTHPTETVRRLSRSGGSRAPMVGETAGGWPLDLARPDVDAPPVEGRVAKPPSRAEEIARLISEAKRQEAVSSA